MMTLGARGGGIDAEALQGVCMRTGETCEAIPWPGDRGQIWIVHAPDDSGVTVYALRDSAYSGAFFPTPMLDDIAEAASAAIEHAYSTGVGDALSSTLARGIAAYIVTHV